MKDVLRVQSIIASLLYSPFLALILINLTPPSYHFELSDFFREAFLGFIILSLVYLLFLGILRITIERFAPYFIAIFIFSYALFTLGLLYIGGYQAPNLKGTIANFYVIPNLFLLYTLWGISTFTVFLMFFMKINNKILVSLLLFTIGISSGFVLLKEIYYRYQLEIFFGNYREGGIAFSSTYSEDKPPYVFHLADRRFKRFPKNDFTKTETPSPGSNFMVYAYSYDRDDLSKIFVLNKKIGKTILLAAGENPIWIK